jgi:hypothetical protein
MISRPQANPPAAGAWGSRNHPYQPGFGDDPGRGFLKPIFAWKSMAGNCFLRAHSALFHATTCQSENLGQRKGLIPEATPGKPGRG